MRNKSSGENLSIALDFFGVLYSPFVSHSSIAALSFSSLFQVTFPYLLRLLSPINKRPPFPFLLLSLFSCSDRGIDS